MSQYGKGTYWDDRYTKDQEQFDWYQRYAGIRESINQNLKRDTRILVAGCGSSRLSEEMFDDGFTSLVNVDSSRVVIDQNIERYKENRPALEWMTMNVTQLEFSDESFDAVIAKGTFDAILCGENAVSNITAFCSQVSRILKSGGVFFIVSYGAPESRLSHLNKEEYNWKVSHQTVPKPVISSSVVPVSDEANNVHYIYICVKQDGHGSSD